MVNISLQVQILAQDRCKSKIKLFKLKCVEWSCVELWHEGVKRNKEVNWIDADEPETGMERKVLCREGTEI